MLHPNDFIKRRMLTPPTSAIIHTGVNLTAFELVSKRNVAMALLLSTAIYCSTSGINRVVLLLKHNTDGFVWITYFASLSFLNFVHVT